jgi:hypothetical protein
MKVAREGAAFFVAYGSASRRMVPLLPAHAHEDGFQRRPGDLVFVRLASIIVGNAASDVG